MPTKWLAIQVRTINRERKGDRIQDLTKLDMNRRRTWVTGIGRDDSYSRRTTRPTVS